MEGVEFDDPFKWFLPNDTASVSPQTSTPESTVHPDDADVAEPLQSLNYSGINDDHEVLDNTVDHLTYYPETRRSARESKPPARLGFDTAMMVQQSVMNNEEVQAPLTFQEAVSGSDREELKSAMEDEMQHFEEKKTWKLTELPQGAKTIKNRWVYVCKKDEHGKLKRRRARLVAKGFSQRKGVDYDEVFASVAKYSTVRMMLAFAAQEELEMLLIDVKTAFLNGKLEETIYMEQPEGFVIKGKESMVYQLLKAIYGLKQASRAWRKLLNAFLRAMGCKQSNADSSLYFLIVDGDTVYILVYVDDIVLFARIGAFLIRVAQKIAARFEIRVEHSVSQFLGMIIEQDPVRKTLKLHSCTLIDQMVERFGMSVAKAVLTPLPEGLVLSVTMESADEGEKSIMERTPYRQLVGCIPHLAMLSIKNVLYAL